MPATPVEGQVTYDYTPSPVQKLAHSMMVDELLYGGAAGGGKSRWARAELVFMALMVPGSRSIIFRRTYPDLEEVEDDLRTEMPPGVAEYKPGKHRWEFYNGSIIRLAHLSHEDDVYKYQGQSFALACFEEATQFTPDQYLYIKGRLRVAGKVKDRMDELGWRPRLIATTNPGGRSHNFFKERFVDAAPPGEPFEIPPEGEGGEPSTAIFIPARYTDNPHIDRSYGDRLNALPENRRKAYRDGDWDILEGVRFPQFKREKHVIRPTDIPVGSMTGQKAIGVDYGVNDPFAAVWLCKLADGLIVVYRELYAAGMTAQQQAERILELSRVEEETSGQQIPIICDPSMWNRGHTSTEKPIDKDAAPVGSPAHFYQQVLGRRPIKANNARVHGWNLLDEKLRVRDDGFPRLMIYDNCLDLIRTLPTVPVSKANPEDLDTTAEEHNLDALRYGTMWLEGRNKGAPAPTPRGDRPRARTLSSGVRDADW